MTDVKTNEKPSPHNIELLLPWHAAGTLNTRDAEDIDKALAEDNELASRFAMVSKEMNETILLNETLGAPSARAMENLFKAIDKERKGVRRRAASGLRARCIHAVIAGLQGRRAPGAEKRRQQQGQSELCRRDRIARAVLGQSAGGHQELRAPDVRS